MVASRPVPGMAGVKLLSATGKSDRQLSSDPESLSIKP